MYMNLQFKFYFYLVEGVGVMVGGGGTLKVHRLRGQTSFSKFDFRQPKPGSDASF